jgi:uncharacterized protein (UPF0262 family)
MADPRLIDIRLDEQTILWRSADIEQERRIAIFDLLEENFFEPQRAYPQGYAGPYKLALSWRKAGWRSASPPRTISRWRP